MKLERIIYIVVLLMLAINCGCESAMYAPQQRRAMYVPSQRRVVRVLPGVPFTVANGVIYEMEKVPATIDTTKFGYREKDYIGMLDPEEKNSLVAGKMYVFVPGLKMESTAGKTIVYVRQGEMKYIDHNSIYVLDEGGVAKIPEAGEGMNLIAWRDYNGKVNMTELTKKTINYQPPLKDVQLKITPPQPEQNQ
jgi:hypothetical protein